MNQKEKSLLLKEAKTHIAFIQRRIQKRIRQIKDIVKRIEVKLITPYAYSHDSADKSDKAADLLKRTNAFQAIENFRHLKGFPYFSKCHIKFKDKSSKEVLYFAKFPFPQESIYSWVAPAAMIRFKKIGPFSYTLPDGSERKGKLLQKDQFVILDGKICYMASEAKDYERTLIYQKFLEKKKKALFLPEIIEQMEEYQDKIIRIPFKGSLLITGPAGSGKTTLALHRVAYLIQSPETSLIFPPQESIIFVHNHSTKKYFSQLLPQLGIKQVRITTFCEWALKRLDLGNVKIVSRFGQSEAEKDILELSKYHILKNLTVNKYYKNVFYQLHAVYKDTLPEDQLRLFQMQRKKNILDRFDLTILLMIMLKKQGSFMTSVRNFSRKKISLEYALIVVDEAENYLPEQIQILQNCIKPKTKALLYVGDLAQQTCLCSIDSWKQIGERFQDDRKVVLQKVYRNTYEILEYIKGLGYELQIPPSVKKGKAVSERIFSKKQEEIRYAQTIVKQFAAEYTIGIISKSKQYLKDFRKAIKPCATVRILSMYEVQGIEFDIVCLVGVNKGLFSVKPIFDLKENYLKERRQVNRDLIYVALTRANLELHITGNTSLKEILAGLSNHYS